MQGAVELHGGTIHAESAGPGKGAQFVVRLPLFVSPQPAEPVTAVIAVVAPAIGQLNWRSIYGRVNPANSPLAV